MKKILILALIFTLSACAGMQTNSYANKNLPLAESGDIKWSTYYKGLYDSIQSDYFPNQGDLLQLANEGIKNAQFYESGKISKEEFDYSQRNLKAMAAKLDDSTSNARWKALADGLKNSGDTATKQSNAYRQNTPPTPAYIPPAKNNMQCQTQNGHTTCQAY